MDGNGYLISLFQSYFKGTFKDNKKNGKGIKIKENGKVYDQIWLNGKIIVEYENKEQTLKFKEKQKS